MHSNFFANIAPMLPELYLCGATLLLLLAGVLRLKRTSPLFLAAGMAVLACTLLLTVMMAGVDRVTVMNGMFLLSGYTVFAKLIVLSAALLALLNGSAWLTERGGKPIEFTVLLLFSVLGMLLLVSANDLMALYVGLELMSLPLYVLAAFERDTARSSEAGLKYFVLGALSSGMMLYGISLVYGFAGGTDFEALITAFAAYGDEAAGNAGIPPALVLGVVLMIVAFCFKVAAAPFHMWSPDVYEGAPTAVTSFFALAPKAAAFAIFARLLMEPFGDLLPQWRQVIVAAAALSMIVGALAALRQTNLKRLLAYSSIGHAGFMLVGLAAGTTSGVQAMLIYLALYIFMSAAAFGCVLLMRRGGTYVETVADLAGLSRTHPFMAFVMAAAMFSMAGIPPLAGFFGKFYVFLAAVEAGLMPLAVLGLVTSVIACYYYLRVVKFMYFDEPAEPLDAGIPLGVRISLAASLAVMLLFFLAPGGLAAHAKAAAAALIR